MYNNKGKKMQEKKIILASDHGGVHLKNHLRDWLKSQSYQVIDCGCQPDESVDYPDFALALIRQMQSDENARGILVCTTGIGMSMMANRFDFIRGALVQNTDMAKMCRAHNDANVLIFGAKYTDEKMAQECVEIFLNTPFEGGRHARRVNKLSCSGGQK
jgi:ribose 5-phosphate isomerase B